MAERTHVIGAEPAVRTKSGRVMGWDTHVVESLLMEKRREQDVKVPRAPSILIFCVRQTSSLSTSVDFDGLEVRRTSLA